MRGSGQLDLEELQDAVRTSLTNWNKIGAGGESSLEKLIIIKEKIAETDSGWDRLTLQRALYGILENAISELAVQDSNGAAVLRARFFEGKITRQVATQMHASPDQVNRWQRSAINDLSLIIYEQEFGARQRVIDYLTKSLPLSSPTHLYGCDEAISEILAQLHKDDDPFVTAIIGIGGIGKTSLANAVVRQIIQTLSYDEIFWLQASSNFRGDFESVAEQSCEQLLHQLAAKMGILESGSMELPELLGQLRKYLNDQSCLVVVDNLETEPQATALMNQIEKLANPSKFLLTTRARPLLSPAVYYYPVEELSIANSAALLREHAQVIGTQALATAQENVFDDIFRLTGGNPLALKLVLGLASVLPLAQILSGLEHSRPGPIESLYRHIYWEAWRTLSSNAQTLLQAMPLVAESGGLPNQMQAFSNLSEVDFWAAVRQLFVRSLIDVQGPINDRRYSIHRLTETFLRTEIIDWPQV